MRRKKMKMQGGYDSWCCQSYRMALYNLKGAGGQSQKLNLRDHGWHLPLWLEEMLLCQALAWPWPYSGPIPLLPHRRRRNLDQALRRAFLLAEGAHRKQGPVLPATQSPSHTPVFPDGCRFGLQASAGHTGSFQTLHAVLRFQDLP